MKISELVALLKDVPDDTDIWFENENEYGEISTCIYIPRLDSLCFIPAHAQAAFDHTSEPGHKLVGDPTSVIWCDLLSEDEEDEEAANDASVVQEGAGLPLPPEEDTDECEQGV